MSRARRELYVYYRVAARDLAAALRIVAAAHARLHAQHPSLLARVLRRADEATADDVTLMEVYRADEGIDGALQHRIEEAAAAMTPLLIGTRHTEAFAPLDGDGA